MGRRFVDARVITRRMDEKDARMQREQERRTAPALVKSCANCDHYDGDHFCGLKVRDQLVQGYIAEPKKVLCAKHEDKERC